MTASEAIAILQKFPPDAELSVRVTRGAGFPAMRLPIVGIGNSLGEPLLTAHDDKERAINLLGVGGWIYHSETRPGNFQDAVEWVNGHHPEWDVVTLSYSRGSQYGDDCTMIVHRRVRK